MAFLRRESFLVDECALKKVKRILHAKTESDAVRQAISLVAFCRALMRGYDRAAGKLPDFSAWQYPSTQAISFDSFFVYEDLELGPVLNCAPKGVKIGPYHES